jgi:hypothetical protein
MRIEVSKYFIDIGCKSDEQNCPIALAISHKIGFDNVESIMVGEDNVSLKLRGGKKRKFQYIDLSQRAKKFIRDFDGHDSAKALNLKPFSFNLPIDLTR